MLRALLAIVCGLLAVGLTSRPPATLIRDSDLRPLLLRPSLARTVSKSQLPLLIDLYWLRAINAIGENDSERKNRALYEYAITLTEMDPRFLHAYIHFGLNIPYLTGFEKDVSAGVYANADLAEDVMRRGLKAYPENMRLHIYLGWVLFGMQRKYAEAAEVYRHAATLPDAWPYMAPFATRLLAQAGKPDSAIDVAKQLIEESNDPEVKAELEGRLLELEVERLLQDVDKSVAAFRAREGRPPSSIDEVVAAKDYLGPLQDSRGGRIYLDAAARAVSTSLDRRLEVYE